jgi:hypothetical protein
MDMDDDVIAQFIEGFSRRAPQQIADDSEGSGSLDGFKMLHCHSCERRSRKACFKCMDRFYDHLHDPQTGGRMPVPNEKAEVKPIGERHEQNITLVESPINFDDATCSKVTIKYWSDIYQENRERECYFYNKSRCSLTSLGRTRCCPRHQAMKLSD